MEENTNSQIQIIQGEGEDVLKALNAKGCSFFVKPNPSQKILVSTSQLRWLTYKRENGGFCTREQEDAVRTIDFDAVDTSINHMNIKLLLYADPRDLYKNPLKKREQTGNRSNEEKERELIRDVFEKLFQCGNVDVRYLKKDEEKQLRIELRGRELFLSFSNKNNDGKQLKVHCGVSYTADNDDDPLIRYYKKVFYDDFNKAKKLTYKNGKIKYADNFIRRAWTWIKSPTGIGILLGVAGLIVGLIGFLK